MNWICKTLLVCLSFNPVMDYYMKANIAHHNHHLNPKTNHKVIPWRHFWDKKEVEKEMADQIFKMGRRS